MDTENQELKNKRLHETFWFWTSIAVPAIASFIFATEICSTSELKAPSNYVEINNFLVVFQLPLGILGLSIPFVAMSAAIHRSSQTALQIAVQKEQNTFSNHFKHLEEFKKSFSDSYAHLSCWKSAEHLHKNIFPNTIRGRMRPATIDVKAIMIFEQYIETLEQSEGIYVALITPHFAEKIQIALDLDISWPTHVKPSHLWDAFSTIEKAFTFSALYESPFKLKGHWQASIQNYTQLDDMTNNLAHNFDQLVSTFESELAVNESLESSIASVAGGAAIHAKKAVCALWLNLPEDKQQRMYSFATAKNKEWLERNVKSVIESQTSPEYS